MEQSSLSYHITVCMTVSHSFTLLHCVFQHGIRKSKVTTLLLIKMMIKATQALST